MTRYELFRAVLFGTCAGLVAATLLSFGFEATAALVVLGAVIAPLYPDL